MEVELAPWLDRARPASDVLNPAISAVCVAWATKRYSRDRHEPLPWALAFLVAPLTLHAPTRAQFPRSAATHFPGWVNDHADVLAGFPRRATALSPYVREGIRYGMRAGLLDVTDAGDLTATIVDHIKIEQDSELRSIATASALSGAWFARAGNPANVFTQLGVKP